jgi:hypothetical protein
MFEADSEQEAIKFMLKMQALEKKRENSKQ